MKKYLKIFAFIFIISCSLLFVGCKSKKDNLDELGQYLSNYYMDINYNHETKSVYAEQTLEYVNNSNAILKEIYLHLYVANFCNGAKNVPVDDLHSATAYPNGKSFATLNIIRLKLNDADILPVYEGEDNDIMKISLTNPLEPTTMAKVYIEYSFTLPNISHRFGYVGNNVNLANFKQNLHILTFNIVNFAFY